MKKFAAVIVFTLCSPVWFFCEDVKSEYLQGSFWCMEYRVGSEGFQQMKSQKEMESDIIRQAREVFSGMIYGYKYRYVPYDKKRKIAEEFDFSPVSLIAEDREIKILQSQFSDDKLEGVVVLSLIEYEIKKMKSWYSHKYEDSYGEGKFSMFNSGNLHALSMRESVRDAIRLNLRQQIEDKPGIVSGRFCLKTVPRFFIESGYYKSVVRIMMNVESFEKIGIY